MSATGAGGTATEGRRVVIVGGGFAGLFAARALRRARVEITLVDRAQHHLFQPLLYQLATGMLSEGQIAVPLRRLLARERNVRCELAEVVDVDPAAHRVVANRPGGPASSSVTTTSSWPSGSGSPTSGTTSSRGGRRG